MKQTLFLLFLLAGTCAFAQDEFAFHYDPQQVVYVLGDSIHVRSEPNTKAKSVAQLPVGTRLKILKISDESMDLNGFRMPWYLVQIDNKRKGYIWGGKLAMESFRSSKNPDIVFHFGLEKQVDGVATFQVRVEKDRKELQRLSFEGFGSALKPHVFTNFGNRGLTNVDDVLYAAGSGEFCGDAGGAVVLFWSGGTLYNVKTLGIFSDVPVFATDTFYFPSDMDGKKDRIILHEEAGEYIFSDENSNNANDPPTTEYTLDKRTVYKWDGKKLVETK